LWSPDLVAAWQDAMRKKPPAAAPARPIQQGYDAYVEAPPPPLPPANPGLRFGGAATNGAAQGGRAYRQGAGYGVDPYTHDPYTQEPYPEPSVPKGGGFASSMPPPPVQHAPPVPPPAPVPVAAPLDPTEAFARNPVQLTAAAAGSLRFTAQQQSMNQFKVRVSAGEGAHRLDFVSGEPNPASDFVYDSAGVTLVVDVNSARSLTGVQVDFGPSPRGIGFSFRRVA
jgi:Fe-S cluster assembly iron-binding protein IscA